MLQIFSITLLIIISFIPAIDLAFRLINENLGANPVEALEHGTGDWAVYFLFMTLSITPIQRFIKPKWRIIPMHLVRRTLGIVAFVYALLHLNMYLVFDMSLDINETITDIAERPFILIGFTALLLLIPLTITSTIGWQKRLKKHWRSLHKLVYIITFLAILHYFLLVKADFLDPLIYLGIFIGLLLLRYKKKPKRPKTKI